MRTTSTFAARAALTLFGVVGTHAIPAASVAPSDLWEMANATDVAGGAGFALGLSNVGLEYAGTVGAGVFQALIPTIHVPDVKDSVDVPAIGHVDITLSSISIKSASIGAHTIKAVPGSVDFALASVSIAMTAHWSYRQHDWPHVKDSGSVDLSVSGTSISIAAKFGRSPALLPTVAFSACSSSVGSVDLHFHGGASWLYNAFKSAFESPIKHALNSELCVAVAQLQSVANAALAHTGTAVRLDHNVSASYSLTASPDCSAAELLTTHAGKFSHAGSTTPSIFTPPTIPVPAALPRMLYVWVTGFLAETAGEAYQEAGVLDIGVPASKIPPTIPIQLNTSSFAIMAPALQKKYPNMAMYLALRARTAPVRTRIVPGELNATLLFDCDFFVVNGTDNSTVTARSQHGHSTATAHHIPVFSLNTTAQAAGSVNCTTTGGTTALHFSTTFLEVAVSLTQTEIGAFDPSPLQTLINFVFEGVLLPQINKAGATGIPIPTLPGVALLKPEIVLGVGYVRIDADIKYTGTPLIAAN